METLDSVLSGLGTLVYHNSPFLLKKADGSFIDPITKEKLGFDYRFMGKGEGSQVHGWGCYFSVEDLRKYAENLPAAVYYDGKLLKDKISELAYHALAANNLNIDNAIYSINRKIETIKNSSSISEKAKKSFLKKYEDIIPELEHLDQSKITKDNNNHNYVVEIPDNDGFNYLEEKGYLSDKQKQVILKNLKKEKENDDSIDLDYFSEQNNNPYYTGEVLYNDLSFNFGSPKKASKFLHKCGFVGVHYFGRVDGECYVIFDENDAKIVKHELFGLGSLISEPTKQTFYENLYNQLESIVKDDSFEKNGIRKFILSHIPEDYKNDDIDGIVEVFYQRLRALKCGGKGLGANDIEYEKLPQYIKEVLTSGEICYVVCYKTPHRKKYVFETEKAAATINKKEYEYLKKHIPYHPLYEALSNTKYYGTTTYLSKSDSDETFNIEWYLEHVGLQWENILLKQPMENRAVNITKNYTYNTTAEEYINDAKEYAKMKLSNNDLQISDLICYKGFEETIFQIVGFKGNNYVVVELGDRTRTKNEIPFADKDKLQRAVSPLLVKEMELIDNNTSLGNVVYENIPLPFDMQLAGLPDDDVELQFTEMKLLEIEKLHDFGEKIGGSAKDRYNGRHSQSGSGNNTNTKKGFNRLPTMEEVEELIKNYDDFCDKFKPSVADFEQLGLNKICARIFFFIYYGDADTSPMYSRTEYNKMIDCAQDLEKQNQISEFFLDNKRTLIYSDYSQNISYRYLYYTALSMNLEKEMKDDFSYQAVLKLLNRGNKYWREYRFWCIFNSNKVSADVKQKVFNIEYENVTNNYPVYRVMLSNKGVIFTVQNELTENKRSYRHSQKYVTVVSNALAKDWNDVWQNYADYYVKGKQLWEEKYGNEEKWKFTDKDGLVAEKRLNCKDWRNGKNAETTDFINTFGFRAVEFGETMPQKERWEHLNRTYDAFMDLCDILNIKPENISLGGTLGICFGSRGRGGKHAAAAHYEPGKRVINLTRKNGAGCLAHEWFHAFDNQVCDAGFGSENAVSLSDEWRSNKVFYYFNSFLLCTETMNWHMFEFARAAFALNRYERRSKPYWQKKLECAARAFEWYVITKLAEKGRINEYLAQIPKPEPDRLNYYPYPHEADYGSCKQIFDGIFENVVQEKTKYNFFTIKG